jgi:hypothetical protein
MAITRLVLPGILVLAASWLVGCGSSSCGAVAILPPTVSVTTTTGAPICNAVVTLAGPSEALDASDASVGFVCMAGSAPVEPGCPAIADASACTIVLFDTEVGDTTPFTIRVSAPGYTSKLVANVSGGVTGCTPTIEPSQVTVVLVPG